MSAGFASRHTGTWKNLSLTTSPYSRVQLSRKRIESRISSAMWPSKKAPLGPGGSFAGLGRGIAAAESLIRGLAWAPPSTVQQQTERIGAARKIARDERTVWDDEVCTRGVKLLVFGGGAQRDHARAGGLPRANASRGILDHYAIFRRDAE